MKCPYCEKTNAQAHHMTAEYNCERYGSNTFYFQCPHCKKIYSVYYYKVIKTQEPCKAINRTKNDVSFGPP